MRLRDALDQAATGALRRMAALHGLNVDDGTTRAELVDELVTRFGDPAYLADQLARLGPGAQRGLQGARAGGGEIRGFLLNRLLGRDDADAARPLLDRGFLFRTFAPLGPHRGEVFAVPDEILDLLRPADGEGTAPAGPPPTGEPPARGERRGSDPVFSLFALASFVQRHAEADPGVRAAGFEREVPGWAQEPGSWPWQERWAFLRHLALATRLFERSEGAGDVVSPRLARLLSDRQAALERLWHAYLHDRGWHELVRAGVPHGETLAEQVDPTVVRGAALSLLRQLTEGGWVPLPDLLAWFERAAPTLLREQLDSRSAPLVDPLTGRPLWGEDSWQHVEAVLLRYLLLGPLYWLGAVACDSAGERLALTRTGVALLGGTPERAPAHAREAEPCTWEPDGHLAAPARADLGLLLRAERYLVLESRGPVSRYRLTRAEVSATLLAGGSVAECRELLEGLTQAALPAEIQAGLDAWGERFGAVVLRPTVLLETRSREDLDAIDPALLRRRLAPTVAEVPASAALDVAEALRAAGQLPRVDAALRLMAGRRAYAALIDEQVLEFLFVSLAALERARPDRLAQLEGAVTLRERLEGLFPSERLAALREAAERLADDLESRPPRRPRSSRRRGPAGGR